MAFVSVIICTHNPRPDAFRRVLDSLAAQTLPKAQWELLLVDNASDDRLEPRWPLSWHSNARHVREDQLGLTAARLRGIRESRGDVLIYVDDDNVLAADQAWLMSCTQSLNEAERRLASRCDEL